MTTRIKAILFVATFMLGAWLLSYVGMRFVWVPLAGMLAAPFVSGRRT